MTDIGEQEVVVENVDEDLGELDLDGAGEDIPDELDEGDLDSLLDTVEDNNVGAIVGGDDDGTE
jgi:hypothetical protein